ncbi:Grx4 family monothiol glutaredoxin [Oleiagrimonas sp.]|jgi:monothiol glutaredoxin|uniref:Grx4 family monothiol glutaredoxin n=1 Tax=Oleiagrimonas sp. TaxID=2010330 RepID=UPI00260C9E88|nr:Grx4 family monothiol glutaredoxin [Oleiagrimonas sp.]MDA3913462.1 Grx4 family monothiol glutaredoxin [Oleiagrimonas sp.]
MSLDSATRERIQSLLDAHRVVLFMKGDRKQPMCGFSAAAVGALDDVLDDYHTINVLEDPEIREGIKVFGDWPTIPQLYIGGELVGGSDIVRQMYASGELHTLFGAEVPDRTPPEITLTDKAAEAIREGTKDAHGMVLHLSISADHNAGFQLQPASEHDIVTVANDIEIHLDPGSAQRARGIVIDWVETMQGAGLSLRFPGATEVHDLSVSELKQRVDAGDITVIDVRPTDQRALAPFAGARSLEEEGEAAFAALPKDTPIAFLCHYGRSSRGVAEQFAAHGFSQVHNVEGGIDAWAEQIDSTVPRY